ncbi:MAG: hypothetical protein A2Z83_03690 [Omnitrophica bacterium GWA2_52_8]|nr:MAG: hypothetical protein A2Z83_03690 [Omnitrophica bacterium GWA2_52_8]
MFSVLLTAFVVVPLVELALLIKIGQWMGVFNTIALVLLTGVSGAWLARRQGFQVIQNMNREFAAGRMPAETMFDGILILCGGLLLLTPGVLTDMIGLILLVPAGRRFVKKWIRRKIETAQKQGKVITLGRYYRAQ